MPRRLRRSLGTHYFHVINRSVRKSPIFLRPNDYRAFLSVLEAGLKRHPVGLLSYCVLANHWHLIVGPTDPSSLSRLMHWVTVTHAVRHHRHRGTVGQGPVYQGRFKSEALEEAVNVVRACRYVERNALTAGLVTRAQDWPWCSLSDRLRPDPRLPLTSAPFLESDAWIGYVNTPRAIFEDERPDPDMAEIVENRPDPLHDPADDPAVRKGGDKVGRVTRVADDDQAHPHVERPKHLRVVHAARALKPRKQWRDRPALAVE
jgi:putative transposase